MDLQENQDKPSVYHRAVKGGAWVVSMRICQQVMASVRLIILFRLLDPRDFGLMGIALLSMSVLDLFTNMGLSEAIVQKKGDVSRYLNAAWSCGIVRGLIQFVLLFIAAPYIAAFFDTGAQVQPEQMQNYRQLAVWIIRLVGFTFLIGALPNIGTLYLQKELTFKRIFVLRIAGTITDTTVSIVLAFLLRSVWALVYGRLAMVVITCLLSYWAHPFRPKWLMDFTLIKELFAYGRHLLGASIVRFIATRSDAIVVGRLLGASSLGLYQSAMKLSTIAFGEIGETLNQVSFPAFANLQDNIAKVRAGYIRSVQVLTMSAYPVACALLVMAHEFTSILLSDKWLPMVPVIQVFCLLGPMQTVMADSVYKSLGRPDIQFRLSVMRFVLLMLAIFPMTKMYGTTGAALAMLITAAIVTPFNFHYVNKLIAFSMWDYVKLVFLPSLACAFMMTALLVLKYFLPVTGYLTLAFAAVAAAAAYLAAIAVLSRMYPQYRIFELLRDVRNVFFPQQ